MLISLPILAEQHIVEIDTPVGRLLTSCFLKSIKSRNWKSFQENFVILLYLKKLSLTRFVFNFILVTLVLSYIKDVYL